ncbi:MAG: hypothetical protein NT160_07025 [Actinobacteria bacterium]|nr:hypothetical protein [Actinomycetota bacterium]
MPRLRAAATHASVAAGQGKFAARDEGLQRMLALRCPDLFEEDSEAEHLRRFAEALTMVRELCPFAEALRLGVIVFPARGPARFFGGEQRVLQELRQRLIGLLGEESAIQLGIADGLFAACTAAAMQEIVPLGKTQAFLAQLPVACLGQPKLSASLERVGIYRLGLFARLPEASITERFGRDAVAAHRVARGQSGELPGLRDAKALARLASLEAERSLVSHQADFFGGSSVQDRRALAIARGVQDRFGPRSLMVARLFAGRDPSTRGRLLPLASADSPRSSGEGPWPGSLPLPSPARVLSRALEVSLLSTEGKEIQLDRHATMSARPASLEAWGRRQAAVAWSAAWPVEEGWWHRSRRLARMQLLLEGGVAVLLAYSEGRWSLEGIYD